MRGDKSPNENSDDEEEEDLNCKTVLLTTFIIRKKRCRVYFHKNKLIWETEKLPYTQWKLPLNDVIAVNYGTEWSPIKELETDINGYGGNPVMTTLGPPTSFVLHYAARGAKNKWSHHSVTMSHDDAHQIASWVTTLRNCLARIKHRPKKILLFVNPFGGKKRGLHVLEKNVKPLMTIAGIDMKIVITERAGHIRDTLLTTDLNGIHAAVCIGGDGTFAELFNGLILRFAKEKMINLNDPDVILPKPHIPVGVIPAGSTDTVIYSLNGTIDVNTAIINIIFGDTAGLDLSSVHTDKNLLRIYASVLSYGYLGDVVKESEKFRWMGPHRYNYSGFKKILGNKGYEGEVMLLSESCQPAACIRCLKNCSRCKQRGRNKNHNDEISRWLTVKGKFFMVNGANISCACDKSPMGFSPHCHIGDGCVDIILVRHTSIFNNIRMLLRITSKDKNLYNLPFVEVYRAKEFTFRAVSNKTNLNEQITNNEIEEKVQDERNLETNINQMNSTLSVWNCDGEVINAPSVRIRVHCQILRVFTRRMQSPTRDVSCFCSL